MIVDSAIEADEIEDELTINPYNNGLTYSNMRRRVSIVVIGLTETPDEFQNTYDHEKGHLAMHIAEEDRNERIKGWNKAVKYAYGWAREEA